MVIREVFLDGPVSGDLQVWNRMEKIEMEELTPTLYCGNSRFYSPDYFFGENKTIIFKAPKEVYFVDLIRIPGEHFPSCNILYQPSCCSESALLSLYSSFQCPAIFSGHVLFDYYGRHERDQYYFPPGRRNIFSVLQKD